MQNSEPLTEGQKNLIRRALYMGLDNVQNLCSRVSLPHDPIYFRPLLDHREVNQYLTELLNNGEAEAIFYNQWRMKGQMQPAEAIKHLRELFSHHVTPMLYGVCRRPARRSLRNQTVFYVVRESTLHNVTDLIATLLDLPQSQGAVLTGDNALTVAGRTSMAIYQDRHVISWREL